MTTMDVKHGGLKDAQPGDQYQHANHFRSQAEEFDAVKLGFWLFLTTEILLFGGIFCAYLIFRAWYPAAWAEGSGSLDWKWGGANTILLLVSSYTMAAGIFACQTGQYKRMRINLAFTIFAGLAFVAIKFIFEYTPKWSGYFFFLDPSLHHYESILTGKEALGGLFKEVAGYGGKRPGMLFSHPFAVDSNVPMWWSVYYCGTALHALHVLVGVALIIRVFLKSFSGTYGPKYYTGVEIAGLYWHLVDLIWIFLFPLLYLIH